MITVHKQGIALAKITKSLAADFSFRKKLQLLQAQSGNPQKPEQISWLLELMPFGIGKRFLIDNLKNHVELSTAFITEIEFKTADEKWSSCWNSISWLKCLVMTITLAQEKVHGSS